ncbi:MAG: phosphoribosylamine--glycine ligase [Calditrichaeota bacterium]|nr:MAG: phosphoribosylamine--glycine ligase [Calditrichota bacterium]
MNILIIGNGAREHAIAWKLSQSKSVKNIYCAPGNPGIAEVATCIPIPVDNIDGLLNFALKSEINLTIPGPEAPLVAGIVDAFEEKNLVIFGPSQKASALEGSKAFSKYFMEKYNIPTAKCRVFTDFSQALSHVKTATYPCVVKADGLAAGKGAIIVNNIPEAETALRRCMKDQEFGEAGAKVLVEDFLTGEEASIFALCDGKNYILLQPAQDHKAIFDGDKGPNTGGMGAYAPAPLVTETLLENVKKQVIEPTLDGMMREGIPYKGVLFIGLMIDNGKAKVLEYNCRFGDPEAQVILPLLDGDLAEIMLNGALGKIDERRAKSTNKSAVCVVMASGGYPGSYETGKSITGHEIQFNSDIIVFHSGTSRNDKNELVTSGGRVLAVTAVSDDFQNSRKLAYDAVKNIHFDGAYFRNDIGEKALKYL